MVTDELNQASAGFSCQLARSAILELADDRRELLRSCGAPGCGAYYVAGRARQQWCSDACGNRARVARHSARRRATQG